MSTRAAAAEPLCGKPTMHGPVAMRSPNGFAPCILRLGHIGRCHAGDPPTPAPGLFDGQEAA